MSQKTITVCDGCGKYFEKPRDIFHLKLESEEFFNIDSYEVAERQLDFCEYCALHIKDTLEEIAKHLRQKEFGERIRISSSGNVGIGT